MDRGGSVRRKDDGKMNYSIVAERKEIQQQKGSGGNSSGTRDIGTGTIGKAKWMFLSVSVFPLSCRVFFFSFSGLPFFPLLLLFSSLSADVKYPLLPPPFQSDACVEHLLVHCAVGAVDESPVILPRSSPTPLLPSMPAGALTHPWVNPIASWIR